MRTELRAAGLALGAALSVALTLGCDAEPAPAVAPGEAARVAREAHQVFAREWRPGDSLLSALDELTLLSWPEPTRSPALLRVLELVEDDTEHVIPTESFVDAGPVDPVGLPRRLSRERVAWRRWTTPVEVSLDAAFGSVSLSVDGETVEAYAGSLEIADGDAVFVAPERELIIMWRPTTRRLQAFAPVRPGNLSVRRLADATTRALSARLSERRPPEDVRELVIPHEAEGELRVGLHLPPGAALRTQPRRLDAERLEFVVSHEGEAWRLVDGLPRRAPNLLRGMDVELLVHTGEKAVAVWHGQFLPGAQFLEQSVPLGPWRGAELSFELRISGGGPETLERVHLAGLHFAGGKRHPPGRPHLVLIDVDTLRADRLGLYGNAPSPSPRLDAWAREQATVFEDCASTSDWTLPATVSLLTGLDPEQHRLLMFPAALRPEHGALAVRLAAAGYETRARTDAGVVNAGFGFHHGFETFVSRRHEAIDQLRIGLGAERDWLAERESERPVFLFVQTYMVHDPYRTDLLGDTDYTGPLAAGPTLLAQSVRISARRNGVSDADIAYLRAVYDAGIRRMDDWLGDFLDALPGLFGDEPYLVLITSDHGEELLDRGGAGHGRSLFQELLHVPLIVRFPDGRPPARIAAPVSLLDVAPTLLQAAGVELPETLTGRALGDALPADHLRVARHHFSEGEMFAALWRGHKLLRNGEDSPELELLPGRVRSVFYDLGEDPGERHDLRTLRARQADALDAALLGYLQALPGLPTLDPLPADPLDEELRRDLQALGYLQDG